MTFPNLPVKTLSQEQANSIQNNSANPNLLKSSRGNLDSASISLFITALQNNSGLQNNPLLIKYMRDVLMYSIALKTMPEQKETLQNLFNIYKVYLPQPTQVAFFTPSIISLVNSQTNAQESGQSPPKLTL